MKTYKSVADTVEVIEKAVALANEAKYDGVETIFQQFLGELLKQNKDLDQAIMIYNIALSSLDDVKSKAVYDNIITRHASVVRKFCAKQRSSNEKDFSEIEAIAQQHITSRSNIKAVKIVGIRKTIRTTKNVGIITPYLENKDAEYAAAAGCSWSAVSSCQVLDGGFLCSYGKKFDTLKTQSIIDIDSADSPTGLTFAEFKNICNLLVKQSVEEYGLDVTVKLITSIVTTTVEKIPAKAGEQGLEKINQFAQNRLKINISDAKNNIKKLIPYVLMGKNISFPQGAKIPRNSPVELGLELLYPVAPMLSYEWISAVNKNLACDFRIGFVDNSSLFYASYDCSHGVQTRLLPHASCSFLVGRDKTCTDKIANTSSSNLLTIAYTWQGSNVGSRDKIEFTLDDLISNKKTFPDTGAFVLKPKMIASNNHPRSIDSYAITETVESVEDPYVSKVNANDIIIILTAPAPVQANTRVVPVWGVPLEHDEAEAILPYLDFIPGQEQDSRQDIIVCRVASDVTNSVANAILAQKQQQFVFIKTKDTWQE